MPRRVVRAVAIPRDVREIRRYSIERGPWRVDVVIGQRGSELLYLVCEPGAKNVDVVLERVLDEIARSGFALPHGDELIDFVSRRASEIASRLNAPKQAAAYYAVRDLVLFGPISAPVLDPYVTRVALSLGRNATVWHVDYDRPLETNIRGDEETLASVAEVIEARFGREPLIRTPDGTVIAVSWGRIRGALEVPSSIVVVKRPAAMEFVDPPLVENLTRAALAARIPILVWGPAAPSYVSVLLSRAPRDAFAVFVEVSPLPAPGTVVVHRVEAGRVDVEQLLLALCPDYVVEFPGTPTIASVAQLIGAGYVGIVDESRIHGFVSALRVPALGIHATALERKLYSVSGAGIARIGNASEALESDVVRYLSTVLGIAPSEIVAPRSTGPRIEIEFEEGGEE